MYSVYAFIEMTYQEFEEQISKIQALDKGVVVEFYGAKMEKIIRDSDLLYMVFTGLSDLEMVSDEDDKALYAGKDEEDLYTEVTINAKVNFFYLLITLNVRFESM